MIYRSTGAGLICASLLLSACTSAPDLRLNEPVRAKDGMPTDTRGKITRAIDHIACELAKAKASVPDFKNYAVAAQLTIKLESSGGVTPSLSFINPLAEAGASRTIGVGGEFNRSRLKSFTQNFVFIVDGLKDSGCGKEDDPFLLTGDLGLLEVVQAGLSAIPEGDAGGSVQWADKKGDISDASQFGSTIQFTTKASANGGLTLSKEKFKGFGGSNGLINGSRVDTDTLVIAFAPIPEVEDSEPAAVAPPKPPAPRPRNLKEQLYNVPSGLTLEELLKREAAPQSVPPGPPAAPPPPPPPPSAEDVQRRQEAKDAAARRSAVESAKRLLDSMILQNIGTTPAS